MKKKEKVSFSELYREVLNQCKKVEENLKQARLDTSFNAGYAQGQLDALQEMKSVVFSGAIREKMMKEVF